MKKAMTLAFDALQCHYADACNSSKCPCQLRPHVSRIITEARLEVVEALLDLTCQSDVTMTGGLADELRKKIGEAK